MSKTTFAVPKELQERVRTEIARIKKLHGYDISVSTVIRVALEKHLDEAEARVRPEEAKSLSVNFLVSRSPYGMHIGADVLHDNPVAEDYLECLRKAGFDVRAGYSNDMTVRLPDEDAWGRADGVYRAMRKDMGDWDELRTRRRIEEEA